MASAPQPASHDVLFAQLRDAIADTDRALLELVNKRLRLVAQIAELKERVGLPLLDPSREEWLLQYLRRANRGPISDEGVAELFETVLALCKRELGLPPTPTDAPE